MCFYEISKIFLILIRYDIKMAHKIISQKQLSDDVFTAEIEAPLVAQARQPGQFVIISINNENRNIIFVP